MLSLYKKQKDLIAKSLEIKRQQLEEIQNKQKVIKNKKPQQLCKKKDY